MKIFKSKKENSIYAILTRFFLLAAVFIVPIFFFPLSSQVLELNKAAVFYIFTLLAAVFWFIDLSTDKEKKIKKPPLLTLLLIFAIIYLISSLFSYQLDYSLVGTINYYHHSLLSIAFFIIFFFIFVNTFTEKKDVKNVLLTFIFSSAVVSLVFLLKIFKLYIFPWEFAKLPYFNLVVNSSTGFSIYLALIVFLCFTLLIRKPERWKQIFYSVLILVNVIILFLLDINAGWYALIIGFAVLLFFMTVKMKENTVKWTSFSALIIAFSILMLFISSTGVYDIGVSPDVALDNSTSLSVTKGSLAKNPLFGSGPGTFYFDLSRFRPIEFNETELWDLSFIKSGSEWWQILSTLGVLGFISYLSLFVLPIIFLTKQIYKSRQEENEYLILLISGLTLIFLSGIFYCFSFNFMFILFLLLSLGSSFLGFFPEKTEKNVLEKYKSVFSSLGLSIVIILAIVIVYLTGRAWLADYYSNKAVKALENEEDLAVVEEYLTNAVENFSWQENYNFSLAQNYLVRAQVEAQQATPDTAKIQDWITLTLLYADKAVQMAEKDPVVYSALAGLYEDINVITQDDISEQIIEIYQKNIDLDKNNPLPYYSLANYYAVYAQSIINSLDQLDEEQKETAASLADNMINEALTNYDQAISLKTNYALAEVSKALTYELKGEIETAVNQMVTLTKKYPLDYTIFYELGRIYFNQESYDLAESALKQVVNLYPGYSNAYWQLSLIYEEKGDIDSAIQQMEIVQELNPDNASVEERLNELKSQ